MSRKKTKSGFVFMDGNNLYHNLKSMKIKPSHIDFEKLSNFVCLNFGCFHKKSFYYNSLPSIEDGQETFYGHIRFLDRIKNLPKFEVKTRKLQRISNKERLQEKKEMLKNVGFCSKCKLLAEAICSDCVGNIDIKEKGIDVMIAVDMLNLCVLKNKCDCCILISGDADFVPVLDLIKYHGKDAFSAFLTNGYAWEIRKKHKHRIINQQMIRDNCLK